MKVVDAKTKACPVMANNCLGPLCMAWRWHLASFKTGMVDGDVVEAEESYDELGGGYCGLAGRYFNNPVPGGQDYD